MYTKYVELRDAKGVNDALVARETGIAPSTFSDWKSGRSKPKIEKLLRLAEFFDTSVDVFVVR